MENSDRATPLNKREIDLLNYWKTLANDANTKRQTERWQKLFQDEETRYGYINSYLDSFLGMQIRVLREQRGWSQTELGERADMKQTRISLLESMNYSAWSVDVLRRLAKAFGLRLVVKFEDFGSYTKEYFEDFDREHLKRRSFENDVIFGTVKEHSLALGTSANKTTVEDTKLRFGANSTSTVRVTTTQQPMLFLDVPRDLPKNRKKVLAEKWKNNKDNDKAGDVSAFRQKESGTASGYINLVSNQKQQAA